MRLQAAPRAKRESVAERNHTHQILTAHTPAGDAPIRGELLAPDRLAQEARIIASRQKWSVSEEPRETPLTRLVGLAAEGLSSDNIALARAVRRHAASPAAEWLLDNYYLIEEQLLIVGNDLPPHYAAELPRLIEGPLAGFPRIYEALLALIAHTDSRIDEETLVGFIEAYQEHSALTIGEVWAVPILLRIAIVDNLRRLSRQSTEAMLAELSANAWAERLTMAAEKDPASVTELVAEIDAEPGTDAERFLLRLSRRLGDLDPGSEQIGAWLEHRLAEAGVSLDRAAILDQQLQAANQFSIANAISTVRFLDALSWREFFEQVSVVERTLHGDPARVYAVMDFLSRDRYRHSIEGLARRSGRSELAVATEAIRLGSEAFAADPSDEARGHVGWWLIGPGRYEFERLLEYPPTTREKVYRSLLAPRGLIFGGILAGLTALFVALLCAYALSQGASGWRLVLIGLLGLLPLSEAALTVTNRLSAALFPPRVMPKLDARTPVKDEHRTLVVVPALLTSVNGVRAVVENLEVAYLANRDANVGFGLLGDLKGGPEAEQEGDARVIEAAVRGIAELNERYELEHGMRPFHLLVRRRTYNEDEKSWMGWERKRGALVELVREMRDERDTTFATKLGDVEFRRSCKFVITLDTDTVLPRDGARRLISTIAHPLNRARLNPGAVSVRAGYGLVQPRVSMALPGSRRSRFAEMYSGTPGVDPYAQAVSDVYQDVFGEGSFTGKGIFEVDVFAQVLDGRFPENTLLSHDLVEGSLLRTALASDVEVLDDYPPNYLASCSRQHRWIRGDWQTLPYLFSRIDDADCRREPNPLTALHRWKIADNLRRSLVPAGCVVLATLGWLLVPGAALAWPVLLAAIVFFPLLVQVVDGLVQLVRAPDTGVVVSGLRHDLSASAGRLLFSLAVLPHQAWLAADAAVRATWRRYVSHRHLLEWETAADAEKRTGSGKETFWRAMLPAAAGAVVMLGLSSSGSAARLLAALPIAAIWILGPLGAWWVSQPLAPAAPEPLTDTQQLELRRIARKTWAYFATFVTAEGHNLVPDNFQEDPGSTVAWRTSPTNIGLQLLASLSAYDLGYLPLFGLVERTAATLATMVGLERFRGHFYNWYDIRTLEPLRPAYVSTVDSGNLAGHLIALRVGLLEAAESPVLGPQLLEGLRDTVRLALEAVQSDAAAEEASGGSDAGGLLAALGELERSLALAEEPRTPTAWVHLAERLGTAASRAAALAGGTGAADAVAAVRSEVEHIGGALRTYLPWAELLRDAPEQVREAHALAPIFTFMPSLVGLAEGLDGVLAELDTLSGRGDSTAEWASAVASGIREARPACVQLLGELRLSADIAREIWEHTDFRVLYDPHRELFSIGYNLTEGRLDASYYDLLASECRLASFVAIAKGDVDQAHWFRLGRALTNTPQGRALVSWSASMFEYLMPLLVMRSWPETLIAETCETVVRRQIAYGQERRVPWGVSESAFNAKDADLTYQYQAFGVPGLGLKRGLSDDVVIAPYASVLSLPLRPHAVVRNLGDLAAEGAEGKYGFYESIDYTPGRVPAGSSKAVVRSYFAHHQGMSLVAIANAVDSDRMRTRFHSDPTIASAELLLQERSPRTAQFVSPHVEEVREVHSIRELPAPVTRSYPTPHTASPATHFLSNGDYSVMVTNAGGGYSRCRGVAISRYREDVTRDCWGTFFYVRDLTAGLFFSAPANPVPSHPDEYNVTFAPDKAEYFRIDGDLQTSVEVSVSPEDEIEIRRLTFTNTSLEPKIVEATSYFEVALTAQASDQSHKAFSNLFIETEALPELGTVLFTRRPRSSEEHPLWGLHLAVCEHDGCPWSFETDRSAFLGRHRGADDPAALDTDGPLGGGSGAVLDPCCAIRRRLTIGPGQTARLVYLTGAASDRETAVRLAEKYQDPQLAQRAIDLAWTAAQLELRDLGIDAEQAVVIDRLASRLLLTNPYSPLKVKTPVENGLPISGLWSLGISGDHPILLVRVEELEHAPLVRQALLAHQYWRHKGLVADLVILNTRPSAYADALEDRLRLLLRTGHALQMLDKPGGVFLRRADQMHPDVLNLLVSTARATLEGDRGSIELQLGRRSLPPNPQEAFSPSAEPREYPPLPFTRPALLGDNGVGGFDPDTDEYVIVLEDGATTPAAWIDVLANPEFGCTVSEAGIGCTWALNSHENRITTWNNDPVTDGSGEVFFIRDEETGEFWSPTPLPVRTPEPYVVRFGRGAVRFEHATHGIMHELEWFVPPSNPVRVCRLRLTNRSGRSRQLSVTQLVEWVLGESRSRAQQLVVTWFDAENEILTAHNHLNPDFPGRCAFVAADRPLHSWTASRTEFVGRNGRPSDPAAMYRSALGGISGRYHDNCGALMVSVDLAEGETSEVTFLLGQTAELEECRRLVEQYRATGAVDVSLAQTCGFWGDLLGRVQVKTPDERLDLMTNGQLVYQTLACRLWGRTATYQSSGAYGFRDQLQDVLGLLLVRPDLVRAQIVEASRHQFPEGDVLHWWQPISGRGVRTHFSDDRHWLPLVVAEYLEVTGDESVLDEVTAFIEAPPLPLEQEDAYVQPTISETAATVYEHCLRAIEAGRAVGAHGLPLIGGGDWNDGMNRIGHGGRGESVWMAWFLGHVLLRFAPICERRGDVRLAEDYRAWAASLAEAAETNGWDGSWYRRAYFDDGTPLGTKDAEECRIDAIAQAWATISGLADPVRAECALAAVDEKLVRREDGLIALLAPPFDKTPLDPGYIKGYVPGVRENGGQYTHAAIWTVLAHLLRGDGDEAAALIDLINPLSHALDAAGISRYKVEPYVVAADVYAVAPHVGRGGWTWYTGSSAWFYRMVVRYQLGLHVHAENGQRYLEIAPCIPKAWPGFELTYRDSEATYSIRVENPRGVNRGVAWVELDGKRLESTRVALGDGNGHVAHEVRVMMLGG